MSKSRSHAVKTPHANHTSQCTPKKLQVVNLHSRPPVQDSVKKDAPAFLTWPSHLFEMMLSPWQQAKPRETWKESWSGFTPLEAWVQNRRAGGKPIFPRTESKETAKAYLYKVELPGIAREQIALKVQDGTIMLKAEISEEQKKKDYYYQHSSLIYRAFTLPVYTNGEAITAEWRDEILTIAIPKTETPIPAPGGTIAIS